MNQKRIARLKELIESRFAGSKAAFARAIDRSPAQVNHWLTEVRPIGDGVAHHIESALSLPKEWMDGKEGDAGAVGLAAIYEELDEDLQKLLLDHAIALRNLKKR